MNAELRAFATQRLADLPVPDDIVWVARIDAVDAPAEMRAPTLTGRASVVLSGAWTALFGAGSDTPDADFFDLGGDSLMLMEAHAQLQKTVPNFDLSIVDLFEYVTIRSLVKHLDGGSSREAVLSEAEERARKQREALAAQKQRRAEQYR